MVCYSGQGLVFWLQRDKRKDYRGNFIIKLMKCFPSRAVTLHLEDLPSLGCRARGERIAWPWLSGGSAAASLRLMLVLLLRALPQGPEMLPGQLGGCRHRAPAGDAAPAALPGMPLPRAAGTGGVQAPPYPFPRVTAFSK